jgi:hypothetical protein
MTKNRDRVSSTQLCCSRPSEWTDRRGAPRGAAAVLALMANAAVLWLYFHWLRDPLIRYDDFDFLTKSRTWAAFATHVWQPMNDQAMPLSRLAAAMLMQVAWKPSAIPYLTSIQAVAVDLLGMWLIYRFVARELGHVSYGLTAMTLWGVTSVYRECVTWYSASFFILSLDTTLVGLLAAQSWRNRGSPAAAAVCATCCALAPGWYAGGMLAGPICAMYLLHVPPDLDSGTERVSDRRPRWRRAAVPLLGTVVFLAVSLPRTADAIVHKHHDEGKTVFQTLNLQVGFKNTLRTLADNQVIGAFGVGRSEAFDGGAALAIDAILMVLAIFWWRVASHRRLVLLGIMIVLASDLLVYGARADWSYVKETRQWTRYHLFPHFGLVLALIGGLPAFALEQTALKGNRLSYTQAGGLMLLMVALSIAHAPRTARPHVHIDKASEVLLLMDRIEEACRRYGIAGDTARAALGFRQLPFGYPGYNAWELVRGSGTPRAISVRDAAAILRPL